VSGYVALSFDRGLEIYLIESKTGKTLLFVPADVLEFLENQSGDRIRRLMEWLEEHPSKILSWLGRMFHTGRGYYMRLEARLDPVERVLKAMDSSSRYVVFHSTALDPNLARKRLFSRLRGQSAKHLFWFVLDLLLSVAALTIAFLPGPNILGWYPFLRSLSHYRAFRGTRSGLRSGPFEFKGLPELRTLEENLQVSRFDREKIHEFAGNLKLSGLEQFLERMI
jgi:Mitochondrial K+-H+ exchange-related